MSKHCIAIYTSNWLGKKCITNLESFNFMIRSFVREFILAAALETIDRVGDSAVINIELNYLTTKIYMVGTKNANGVTLIFTLSADREMLVQLASSITRYGLLVTIEDNYEYLHSETKIKEIKEELNNITAVLIDDVNKLLNRGEELSDILQKTEHLTESTKILIIKTEEFNKCCHLF